MYDGNSISLVDDLVDFGGSYPQDFIALDGKVFFSGYTSFFISPRALWCYDIATDVVSLVMPGNHITNTLDFSHSAIYEDKLYFSVLNGTEGDELRSYDGTTMTTVASFPSTGGSGVSNFGVFDGRLYFSANSVTAGRELHSYDGTTLRLVKDVRVDSAHFSPRFLNPVGEELLFIGNDGIHGPEWWSMRIENPCDTNGNRIVLEEPVSIGNPGMQFNLYPNPANDNVVIDYISA